MDQTDADALVQQLTAGFEALQDEYQKLFEQHHALERKLATARDQYNEVARLYGSGAASTPPLSLASSPGKRPSEPHPTRTAAEILEQSLDQASQSAALRVREASQAVSTLRHGLPKLHDPASQGVKIWSGRSADRHDASSMMPSISESPLEQDFTIEGKPSKLGCPFASMANKKLSSHAASVLSRYNTSGAGASATPSITSANRINGRESLQARKSGNGTQPSIVDPIKAEICGLSDHDDESPHSERALKDHLARQEPNAEVGVCPIRFLDQHSPEEVATYFERHKHELPRSHEVCVRRYQSNEKQIRELDDKYGNLVSMIQGLGAKHKGMLPNEPEEDDAEAVVDAADAAKIKKWASSVTAMGKDVQTDHVDGHADDDGDERQPHFARPLRDVRVGESPSRPWGVPIPAKYLEAVASEESSEAVETSPAPAPAPRPPVQPGETATKNPGKCPFGHSGIAQKPDFPPETTNAEPVFVASQTQVQHQHNDDEKQGSNLQQRRMVFTGPVFIGYSAEDAAKILRESKISPD